MLAAGCLSLAVLVVLLAIGATRGPDGRLWRTPVSGGAACGPRWGRAVEVGSLPGSPKEISGFVSSSRYPGVAWMVRDSGNPATLYSFEITGRTLRSRAFPVNGATNGDWEDLAYTTGSDGRGRLWIEDNINRSTAPKTLWEVLEPDPATDRTATVVGRYRWEYPDGDGNHDTEVLFALGGELVVISKTDPSRAYRFETPLAAGRLNRPVPAAEVPSGSRMTLGSTSADERLLLTSSTRDDVAWVYRTTRTRPDVDDFLAHDPLFSQSMTPSQREAGDFFPHDGCDIVLISERASVWLLSNRR